MEDPATWGPLEKAIKEQLDADAAMKAAVERGASPVIGLSLTMRIANAVRRVTTGYPHPGDDGMPDEE